MQSSLGHGTGGVLKGYWNRVDSRQCLSCSIVAVALVALFLSLVSTSPYANEALKLEADSASYNNKTGVSVYRGNVKISQGDIVLEGDVVEVYTDADEVSKLIATANPSRLIHRDEHQSIRAEAQRIEYKMAQGIVDFIGQVRIREAEKLLIGEHAVYDVRERTITMKKNKRRVKLIIQP